MAEGRRQPGETVEAFVVRLALAKAHAVVHDVHDGLLVTCDTVGEIDGEVLGKPAGIDEARRMLRLLSGRRHRVVTGTCVWPRPAGHPIFAATESRLFMEPLSGTELEDYLASGLWQGKAGACGFQDGAIPLRLEAGSGSNVVGLPVETLREIFSQLGA